jgi:hypothetical protein
MKHSPEVSMELDKIYKRRNIVKSLILVGMVVCAHPVMAVTYMGAYHAISTSDSGITFKALPTDGVDAFCYLSRVNISGTGSNENDTAECRVLRRGEENPLWFLRVYVDAASEDAKVRCSAMCYYND